MVADSGSVTREFVQLGRQTYGVLYGPPALGPAASVGLILMHPNADYVRHIGGVELARRGFRALCINGQYFNTRREYMIWENVPLDVKPAVEYVRKLPGITAVVLVGHSGGGQLMPYYQSLAESGGELPPSDGVVLLDGHHGYAANTLTALDPAVIDESVPNAIDRSLDVFNAANGYGAEFKQRYFRAQAERMLRLTAHARARLEAIEHGTGRYPDDEPFPVARIQARLWQLDTGLISHTKQAYPVLKPDGSVVTEVPRSVRVSGVTPGSGGRPDLTPEINASFHRGAVMYTVRSWLSSNALSVDPDRYTVTEDDIRGIDWHSSATSTPANLEHMHAPLLMLAMTGHYWMVPAEIFLQHAASADKQLAFVEGASHNLVPCTACEQFPGQYGDTVKTIFDYVAAWLDQRFVR